MKITIHTYTEFERHLHGFAAGHGNLLAIIGSAGLQKSVLAEKICTGTRRLSGAVTAFALYRELWRNRDRDFIIDDVDQLYGDKAAIRLLKNLCDTRATKIVQWHSAAAALISEDIPTEFQTRTRLIIVANEWRTLNRNVGALQDRGIVLNFKPTAVEVHDRLRDWFEDAEIFEFIGNHLHLITEPSMRTYITAVDLKAIGSDWREVLLKSWNVPPYTAEVSKLLGTAGLTQEQRAQQFITATGGCRATFFNIRRRLGQSGNG